MLEIKTVTNGPVAREAQRICLVKVEGQQLELHHEN